jgi:hypothetical protein
VLITDSLTRLRQRLFSRDFFLAPCGPNPQRLSSGSTVRS